ncbi:hypothetical protein OH76DRAFT_279547 [Lentinus brumalis]|uniref:Uncharacterized protein n=1 Tax=Lentinus brumalis TaxID=2498619 RepID=A0A371CKW1_9APHY|nr:hypothetical protein OH76DRAFT_279547 [Polyporus brumalis]
MATPAIEGGRIVRASILEETLDPVGLAANPQLRIVLPCVRITPAQPRLTLNAAGRTHARVVGDIVMHVEFHSGMLKGVGRPSGSLHPPSRRPCHMHMPSPLHKYVASPLYLLLHI